MASGRFRIGVRGMIAGAVLLAAAAARAQVATAGTLLVDLRADDFATFTRTSVWINRGNGGLGDFRQTPGADPVVVSQAGSARGLFFRVRGNDETEIGDGMLCDSPAPAGLLGDSDWSVEVWYFNPSAEANEPLLGWGDQPGNCVQLCGGSGLVLLSYGAGDCLWAAVGGANPPGVNRWVYLAVTYSGAAGDPPHTLRVYVDGVKLPNDYRVRLATHEPRAPNPTSMDFTTFNHPDGAPIAVGGMRSYGAKQNALPMPGVAGWAGGFIAPTTCLLNRVRIHDGQLTAEQVAHNYYRERDAFLPPR